MNILKIFNRYYSIKKLDNLANVSINLTLRKFDTPVVRSKPNSLTPNAISTSKVKDQSLLKQKTSRQISSKHQHPKKKTIPFNLNVSISFSSKKLMNNSSIKFFHLFELKN